MNRGRFRSTKRLYETFKSSDSITCVCVRMRIRIAWSYTNYLITCCDTTQIACLIDLLVGSDCGGISGRRRLFNQVVLARRCLDSLMILEREQNWPTRSYHKGAVRTSGCDSGLLHADHCAKTIRRRKSCLSAVLV